jgi:class 3 adenylate cyclase
MPLDIAPGQPRAPRELVIAFLDLSLFTQDARRHDDMQVADMIDAYYERVAAAAHAAGGHIVKVIGDGVLLVFDPAHGDEAITALLALKSDVDAWLAGERWQCRLVVKAHCDVVIAGGYGAAGNKRFDVIGNAVNLTARIAARSFAVSPQVFRLLSPETRQKLKKHTPPITYIPLEEPHT